MERVEIYPSPSPLETGGKNEEHESKKKNYKTWLIKDYFRALRFGRLLGLFGSLLGFPTGMDSRWDMV